MRTRLTEMLGIDHPVMLAGMGGVSYHELVAAVSEAGGIGTLGASTMRDHELPEEMRLVRERTAKPFGVDLLTALPNQVDTGIKAVIEGGASIFVAGLGVPREVIDLLHQKNILVGSMCGKVKHALAAVASGCDFVVAQGTEAGGHTGMVATMALVPQVVDAVGEKVPVVAAGGLFDGRGLAASLALGADGVWIGTRFIATPEARAVNGYKDQLLSTSEDGDHHQPRVHGQDVPRGGQRLDATLRQEPGGSQALPTTGRCVDASGRQSSGISYGNRSRRFPRVLPCRTGCGCHQRIDPRWGTRATHRR